MLGILFVVVRYLTLILSAVRAAGDIIGLGRKAHRWASAH